MPERRTSPMSAEDMVRVGAEVESINAWVDHHLGGNWFTSDLMRLWQKADPHNRDRIRMGFPDVAEIMEAWYAQRSLWPREKYLDR